MNGKGDKDRTINHEQYRSNYESIFKEGVDMSLFDRWNEEPQNNDNALAISPSMRDDLKEKKYPHRWDDDADD